MYYYKSGKRFFKVYSKPGYNTKYVKRESMHTNMCVNAIEKGVCTRLASLTSRTPESEMKSLFDIFPDVYKALRVTDLLVEGK